MVILWIFFSFAVAAPIPPLYCVSLGAFFSFLFLLVRMPPVSILWVWVGCQSSLYYSILESSQYYWTMVAYLTWTKFYYRPRIFTKQEDGRIPFSNWILTIMECMISLLFGVLTNSHRRIMAQNKPFTDEEWFKFNLSCPNTPFLDVFATSYVNGLPLFVCLFIFIFFYFLKQGLTL